jgi:ATP-dependent Lhr-like helicase
MVFELLNPELQNVIKKRFKDPTLPQQLTIPVILSGVNVLLIAETGTGKTESAMLPVFNSILTEKPKPISALYITPLKALNRDLMDRMLWWANHLGLEIGVRHGDTSAYERKLQVEFPSNLLFVTLETLQPILIGKRIRELLRNVKWVILDEVHEIADSKRGVQLALALERLKELCGDFQLIMLSATVGQPEEVAKFFSSNKVVKIIKADTTKKMEIKVIYPEPIPQDKRIAEKIFSSQETAARLRTIMELIKNSQSTLTFTNTREFAEVLTSRIKNLDKKFPVAIHHSSLSKEVRIKAEKEFKEEKLKSLISTSSLQLGIDVGSVDLIIQYMSPRQISQLVQRVGRSGHALEKISKGIIISTDEDDVFESAVIARKALAGELEPIKFHENSYDVLAHQLIGLTFDFGKIELEKAYEIIKRASPYRNMTYAEFLEVCKQLERLGLAFLDGYIKKRTRGFDYYFTQLSTIPSIKQYRIFNTLDNSFVGVLDEEFVALHGEVGTTFIVKGESWKIVDVTEDKILVEPTVDVEAAIPGWEGELIPVPLEVSQEVGRLRRIIFEKLKDESERETINELCKLYPIDENCARLMIDTIKKQKKYGVIPDDKTILIEEADNFVVIHSCFGTQVNDTIGRFLSALLTARVGSVGLKVDPYRIMIEFQQKNIDLVKEILFNTPPEHFRSYLEMSLSNTQLFEWKFIHVARRFGAISRDAEFGKLKMKKIIEEYVGTPIYKETLKELETEKLDVEGAIDTIKKIQSKQISVVFKSGSSYLGNIGIKHKFGELVAPKKPELEIFELFKNRLLNTKVRLVCVNCGQWYESYIIKDMPEDVKCRKCSARFLNITRSTGQENLKVIKKNIRKSPLTTEEKRRFERIKATADLYLTYRKNAVIALGGRGVGPVTANRILRKYHKTQDDLLRDILEAERQFIKTKKYWKI